MKYEIFNETAIKFNSTPLAMFRIWQKSKEQYKKVLKNKGKCNQKPKSVNTVSIQLAICHLQSKPIIFR